MKRQWLVNRTNPEFIDYLSKGASISPVLAQVLVNRGIKDAASIKSFLYPSLDHLHDPFLLPDMQKAVDRLKDAADRGETVLVHGDYDADGITSAALLVSTFRRLGLKTHYHIPNRIIEGYGLSAAGIQKATAVGATLLITADCGISSAAEVSAARSAGIDVIVTDHHEPPEHLPEAVAVIDPHRADSKYPFRYLAGVGVAFKLAQALVREGLAGLRDVRIEDMLDLVALGTIADSVPLLGENRVLAAFGLREMNISSCRTGIRALKKVSGVNGDCRAGLISFTLIPRINAAGRLDDAGEVVELFLTEDDADAKKIASLLDEQNKKRQKVEGGVLRSALDMISPDSLEAAIVLSSHDWHPGVIGIVASRLVDMFYRPVFLFSIKDAVAKGSARTVPPIHLYETIAGCSDLLLGFGGHRHAAGLRLAAENLPAFRDRINLLIKENFSAEDMVPTLEIEASVNFSDLSIDLINELNLLEPFGESNRQPVFGAKNIDIISQRIVGNNHLKMQLRQDRICLDTIGFSMGDHLKHTGPASSLDIAFVPGINEWNGSRSVQLNLKAIRPGG